MWLHSYPSLYASYVVAATIYWLLFYVSLISDKAHGKSLLAEFDLSTTRNLLVPGRESSWATTKFCDLSTMYLDLVKLRPYTTNTRRNVDNQIIVRQINDRHRRGHQVFLGSQTLGCSSWGIWHWVNGQREPEESPPWTHWTSDQSFTHLCKSQSLTFGDVILT